MKFLILIIIIQIYVNGFLINPQWFWPRRDALKKCITNERGWWAGLWGHMSRSGRSLPATPSASLWGSSFLHTSSEKRATRIYADGDSSARPARLQETHAHTHTHARAHTGTHTHTGTHMHTHTHAHTHTQAHAHTHRHAHTQKVKCQK